MTVPTGIRIAVFTEMTPTTARVIQAPIIKVKTIPKIKFFIFLLSYPITQCTNPNIAVNIEQQMALTASFPANSKSVHRNTIKLTAAVVTPTTTKVINID